MTVTDAVTEFSTKLIQFTLHASDRLVTYSLTFDFNLLFSTNEIL